MECNQRAQRALEIASRLLELANEERDECEHDGCLLLDGMLRDCALQIRRTATMRFLELQRSGDAHYAEGSK